VRRHLHPAPGLLGIAALLCLSACHRDNNKAPQKSPAWDLDLGTKFFAQSPAVASDGTVYVGTHSGLLAISPDGKRKWKGEICDIVSAPVIVSHGSIYVADSSGSVRAYGREGSQLWRSSNDLHARDLAAAHNGTVYVLGQHLNALTPDRTIAWSSEQAFESGATLAINEEGLAVVSNGANVYVYRPDGQLWWKANVKNIQRFTGAAIGKNDVLYFASDNGVLYALYNNGETRWNIGVSPTLKIDPVIDDHGNVYIGSDMLNVINSDGKAVRGFPVHVTSTPALASDGSVVLTSDDGHVYSVRSDASEKWETDTHQHLNSAPAIAPDGTVYVLTDEGHLIAISDDNGGLMDSPWPKYHRDAGNTAAE
jgi:outer membrane protein assembly factor BamB